jgi:hypothetical protein
MRQYCNRDEFLQGRTFSHLRVKAPAATVRLPGVRPFVFHLPACSSSPAPCLFFPWCPLQKSNNARTFWYTGLEVLVLLLVTGVNLAVTTGFFKGGPSRITV